MSHERSLRILLHYQTFRTKYVEPMAKGIIEEAIERECKWLCRAGMLEPVEDTEECANRFRGTGFFGAPYKLTSKGVRFCEHLGELVPSEEFIHLWVDLGSPQEASYGVIQ